jgi:hypothetical protein
MEPSMSELDQHAPRSRTRRALTLAAALLCAGGLSQPNLAVAGPHGGGGGFHGGGFGGGFHGGGFHEMGGFRGGGFGGFHGGQFHDGRFDHNRGFFFGGGVAYPWLGDYPYGYDGVYSPEYGYYGYSQPYPSQTWYYCSDPAGYYPYVTQCNIGWQAVPAS